MTGLTQQQGAALTFIDRYIAANGCSPSYDEISSAVGLQARSGAHRLVHGLRDRGYVRFRNRRDRTIEVVCRPPGADLPMPGPAALARASDEELERLALDLDLEQFARRRVKAIARADAILAGAA